MIIKTALRTLRQETVVLLSERATRIDRGIARSSSLKCSTSPSSSRLPDINSLVTDAVRAAAADGTRPSLADL